jgi:phosphatidate phosphatase APP1
MLSQQIATNIGCNDRVIIYPAFGWLSRDSETWQIPVTGTVSEVGDVCRRKRRWLELLQRLNKFHPSAEQHDIFEERVNAFVARTSRGKQLAVRVANHVYTLDHVTDRNGVFSNLLQLPAAVVDDLQRNGHLNDGWLQLEVIGADGVPTGFAGSVRLLSDSGHSVISDIDDTLKVTHVTRKRSLLENTFLRPFEAVLGMADVYRRWAADGVAFHYVSSSPWQLFSPLRELFEQMQLPIGAFHLSSFSFQNHVLHRVWMLRKRAKLNVLQNLLQSFPQRKFSLIGDSGERDPEIYGALARRYPSQIAGIFIRELGYRPMSAERLELAFHKRSRDCVQVFRDPLELPGSLLR